MTAEVVVFWVLSVVAVGAAIAMVTMRNVVHGALMLVLNFFAIAGLFLVLGSSFLAIVQLIVYAGAIMVLFLFVIMLLGIDRDDLLIEHSRWSRVAAWGLAGALATAVGFVFIGPYTGPGSVCDTGTQATGGGTSGSVACVGLQNALGDTGSSVRLAAETLFTRYLFSFEFVALVLVVATVGALVIGRRATTTPTPSRDIAEMDLGSSAPTGRVQVATPHAHGGADDREVA